MSTLPEFVAVPRNIIVSLPTQSAPATRAQTGVTSLVNMFTAKGNLKGSLLRRIIISHIGTAAPTVGSTLYLYFAAKTDPNSVKFFMSIPELASIGETREVKFFDSVSDGMLFEDGVKIYIGCATNGAGDSFNVFSEFGDMYEPTFTRQGE